MSWFGRYIRYFLLAFVLLPFAVRGQQKEAASADSVINTWDLERDAWTAWQKIDSVWMAEAYWPCLKRHKLKMSCSGCEDILMHVDMQTDTAGKLIMHRVVSSDQCGNEFSRELENELMEFFYKAVFPAPLRGKVFRTLLGTGLKC